MLISAIIVVCSSLNYDNNSIADIAGAIKVIGGDVGEVADNGVIQATIAAHEIDTIALIPGVTYIRPEMSWYAR